MRILSRRERWFDVVNYIGLALLAAVCLYPVIMMLAISLNKGTDTMRGGVFLWPRAFTLVNYRVMLENVGLRAAYKITILRTALGTALSVFTTALVAYGLSEHRLPGRKYLMVYMLIPMFFSGGLIPYYLLIRSLGLMNTFAVLFVPTAVNTWNFLVIKSFFTQLPAELEESARMDGASDLRVFFRIVLPLSLPVLATFTLFYAVGYWNTWWPTTLFIQKKSLFTLQYVLRGMIVENRRPMMMDTKARQAGMIGDRLFDEGIKMATVIVATIPILCVYPFLQKYFAKGVMIGAVKG